MLKQSNDTVKVAATQNIVPANEVPKLANEVVTMTTNEPATVAATTSVVQSTPENSINPNASNAPVVEATIEQDKKTDVQLPLQTNVVIPASVQTTPPKIVQQSGQFFQVKPPTTTSGRVQSPNVKNFFIRKGIEKQAPAISQIAPSSTGTFITATQTAPSPQMAIAQLPANKKIIIKSQQILVPANQPKQQTRQILQVTSSPQGVSSSSVPMPINANIMESSSSDLAGILDLPILFADNSDNSSAAMIDQTTQILNASGASTVLMNTLTDRNAQIGSPTNIFFSTTDGKLPNRPVVISAAKVNKPIQQTTLATTSTNNKVIFINRNQIKQQLIGSQTMAGMSGTQLVKGLTNSILKLVPTSLASSGQSTPITLHGNQIAKLSPGTKIDFSTLKLVKNAASASVSGGIVKPLVINKAMTAAKGSFVIKSPMGGNVQAHQVLKGNVLNRNITVRKVMNVIPGMKQVTSTSATISTVSSTPTTATVINSSPTPSNTLNVSNTSPAASASSPKTTRKTRSSY